MGVCAIRRNLPPALFAERPGSVTCYSGNKGVERTLNKTVSTEVNPGEEKLFCRSCREMKPAIFRSRIWQLSYLGPHVCDELFGV